MQVIGDAELVARSRRRDAEAFGELVERHQQLVFGVALARCHDPALAEDVAQDAFVAAWRDLDRLRDGDRVGSWVAGIARNLAASAVRTRVRREADPGFAVVLDDVPTPHDAALEREDRELLARALADVPEAHRETLVLFYLEGESIAGIAEALGITEDLVKQRLSRGRKGLRDSIAARVESALTRARLRPAFRAGVVAALATVGTREAAAATTGKAIVVMTTKQIAVAVAAVVVLAGGIAWWTLRGGGADGTPVATAQPTTGWQDLPGTSAPAPAPGSAKPPAKPSVSKLPDKAARTTLLESIRQAHERRAATAARPSETPAPALPEATIDKQYIRAAVRELIPLLGDCYLEGMMRDPKIAGSVHVDFTIEGEADVGAVIGESAIDKTQSEIKDPAVLECIQETMYALKIDPPPTGGVVRVHYPFLFHPAPPDDAAEP